MMFLVIFFAIYLLGAPQGLTIWWIHILACSLALFHLHKLSKYYLSWILILVAVFASSEPRFSIEYLLLATGFMSWGLSNWWQAKDRDKRAKLLLWIFVLLVAANYLRMCFYERGSLLLWLPVFLALYYGSDHQASLLELFKLGKLKPTLINLISGLLIFFSNKKTTVLAYIVTLAQYFRSKYFYILGLIVFASSFLFIENWSHFYHKSLESRLFIWQACLEAWWDRLIVGHGFGTFVIDFPPYRSHAGVFGAKTHEQVSHGHSLFAHFLFEQGFIGLILLIVLFYVIYRKAPAALLPLLVLGLFDAPLVSFSQYLLAGLILMPYISQSQDLGKGVLTKLTNFVLKPLNQSLMLPAKVLLYIIVLIVFTTSLVGHYYYDHRYIDEAIKWDPYNSLYHFMRGSALINRDVVESEKSLVRAVELAPSVSYYHGFLAAAKLANMKFDEAKEPIAKALEMDGGDGYWYLLSAFAHYNDDKELYEKHYAKALKRNPEIKQLISDPSYTSSEYIGSKKSDARVAAFYRKGPKVFIPLPYFEQ